MERAFLVGISRVCVAFLCGACSAATASPPPSGAGGGGATSDAAVSAGGSGGTATRSGGATGSGGSNVLEGCTDADLKAKCGTRVCGPANGCLGTCGTCADTEVCVDGTCKLPTCDGDACKCGAIDFTVATRQSCSIGLVPGAKLDGEAFIDTGSGPQRVFAMNRWGKGHVVAWCDSSTTAEVMDAFNAEGYLGQTSKPRVASFGNMPTCKPGYLQPTSMPMDVTYLGSELPAKYTGNPGALAADWDAVVFCGFHTAWDPGIGALIQSYVTQYGRGYLAVMDYYGYDIVDTDFTNMTAISKPAGFVFNPVSLDWADLTATVKIDCVPDLPPRIR
jgi:hypothetical protein